MDWKIVMDQAIGFATNLFVVGGALGTAYKASATFRGWVRDVAGVPKKIKSIEAELTTDGGRTLRDAVLRTERSMIAAQRKSEILFKAMGIAEFIADFDGQFVSVNSEFCRLVGRSEDDCLGWGWVEYVKMNVEEYKRLMGMRVPIRLHVEIGATKLVMIGAMLDAKTGYYGVIINENAV